MNARQLSERIEELKLSFLNKAKENSKRHNRDIFEEIERLQRVFKKVNNISDLTMESIVECCIESLNSEMKTFDDLVFEDDSIFNNPKIKAIVSFENGYGVSVIQGHGCYTKNENEYELAVLNNDSLCYSTRVTNDVVGYIDKEEVSRIMINVQLL